MASRTIRTISPAMARDALGLNGPHSYTLPSSPRLSRRQFLATGLLASGALSAAPGGICIGTDLQFCRVAETGVALRRQALLVSLGQLKWLIEPQLFGPHATLDHKPVAADQSHRLKLDKAHFPGTDLHASFTATLYRSSGIWMIRLRFDEVGQQIEFPLQQWMERGEDYRYSGPMKTTGRRIQIGVRNCTIAPHAGAIRFAIDADMNAVLSAEQSLLFSCRRFEFSVGQALCSPARADAVHPGHTSALVHATAPFTNISFRDISSGDNELPLVEVGGILSAHVSLGSTPTATLVGHGDGDSRDATFILGGAKSRGTLIVRGGASGPSGTRIALQPWAVLGNVNSIKQQLRFAATLEPHPGEGFPLETNSLTALVSGIPSQLIELDLARPLSGFNFNVHLRGAHIPIPGASAARLAFAPEQTMWVTVGEPAVARPENNGLAHLHLEDNSVLDVALDTAVLHLRRSADCLDLSFILSHYSLRVSGDASEVIQRPIPRPVPAGQPDVPCLAVHFHPQHEFEEVFKDVENEPPFEVPEKKSDTDKTPAKRGARRALAGHGYPELARTRLANHSRLVFQLAVSGDAMQHQELTMAWLTDWKDATLKVNPRALDRSAGLREQLALVGIKPETTRAHARELVKKTILGTNMGIPEKHETAIEPVYRMIVSPDKRARFVGVPQAPNARYPLLWRVELENHADVATRALWARGMDTSLPMFDSGRYEPDAAFDRAFTGSLDANDRRELVVMTSFYGVAALRRLIPAEPKVPFLTFVSRAVGLSTNPPTEWQDDPNGMVFLPQPDPEKYPGKLQYDYLSTERVNEVLQEGVMQAKPFDRFRLRMGRAADMDAFWKGEPPAQMYKDPFFHPAFTVERYSHRTVQGRDVFVEVLYKGFLFPLGHRASFIKVSYRDFKSYMGRTDGDPTAYLVQELYIVCNKPVKQFKAYNQPYDSHDFPCETVTLLTTKTGKLDDIELLPGLNPPQDGTRPEGKVFWPVLAATKKDVIFSYLIDGQSEPAHSPLLFVDNAAAHDQVTMSLVIKLFNDAKRDNAHRIMSHGQAVRRYAPEKKGGQCSFKTRQWVMAARGRINPQDGLETYTMDAFMEGQDQPPFYPVVEVAAINVESVERLTGQAGLYIDTAFNGRYVQFGFDGTHNPSEIFMDVLTPGLYLNGNATPGATGGVASMAALLAGLSRKIGPVGGQATAQPAPGTHMAVLVEPGDKEPHRPAPLPGGPVERQTQMRSALGGGFNPLEFLGDAKLLGCILLKNVCMAALIASAPKLMEQVKHGVQELDNAVEKIRNKLADAIVNVNKALKLCRDEIYEALEKMYPGLKLKDLYAGLDQAITGVEKVIGKADALLKSPKLPNLDELQDITSEVKITVDELVHQLESIARDPVPTIIKESMQKIEKIWKLISNPGEKLVEEIANLIVAEALDALVVTLCARDNRYLLRAVFGAAGEPLPQDTDEIFKARIKTLLRNPADALEDMRDAVLYEAFAKPLLELLQAVSGAAGQAIRKLAWQRRRVVNAITGLIRRNAASLPAERFTALAERIADEIELSLNAPGDIAQLPDRLKGIVDAAVAKGLADMGTVVAQLRANMATELTNTTDAINRYLADEMKGAVDEADRERYRRLQGTIRKLADMKKELDILVNADWKAIAQSLAEEALAELKRAEAEKLKEIENAARREAGKLVDSAVALVSRLFTLLESWSSVRTLQKLGADLGDVCKNTAPTVTKALDSVAVGLMSAEKDVTRNLAILSDALNRASEALDTLDTGGEPAALRDTAQANLTNLMTAVEAVRGLCGRSEALRGQWNEARKQTVCRVDVLFDLLRKIAALRAQVPEAITSALAAAALFADPPQRALVGSQFAAAPFDVKTEFAKVEKALLDLLGNLTGLAKMAAKQPEWAEHTAFVEGLAKKVGGLKAHIDSLQTMAERWLERGEKALETARAIQGKFEELDRKMVAVVVQLILPQASFIAHLETAIVTLAQGTAKLLIGPHGEVVKGVSSFKDLVATSSAGGITLASLLSQDLLKRLEGASDALDADSEVLKFLKNADAPVALANVNKLSAAWAEGRAGLVLAVKLVGDVVELVTSGNVMTLFKVGETEKALRDAVASFLPTRIALSYDFDAALSDFPSGSPIFTMDRANYGTIKERLYEDKRYPINDLVLKTRIDIDLMTGERSVSGEGRMRPFTLNLLGGAFDLIGISFSGARFQSKAGGKLAIDTNVSGVRIGAMLEFLSLIQSYFSSGTENGLYYDLKFLPPALEVGYRFNQPFIGIGTMALLNIGFKVGAMLPLDGRQAEFFCSMSTREYPLLIVMTPYGGGGFFGLRTTAQGIIAFEIQLEFGFVGALVIGPLSAQARATAGIYMLQGQGQRVLEGFFHAIGEGHLGCFGVGVNIEIKMRQENNGSMEGSASYSYSFSVGFFEIEFEVVASRSQDNGSGGGASAMTAAAAQKGQLRAMTGAPACPGAPPPCNGPDRPSIVKNDAVHKDERWDIYRTFLDLTEAA